MTYQTKTVTNKTAVSVPILISIVVLLLGLCVGLVASDSLRNAIRIPLKLPPAQPIDFSAEEHYRRQLLEIAAGFGLVAVSADLATLVKATVHDRDGLRTQNADLNRKHGELDARYRDLDAKHVDLQTKHVALDHQQKQLQVAHGELDKQHQQVKAEKIQYEARTKQAAGKFSRNLSSRLVKSTTRQVASAPAESIPFAGIPLVAASTAWDIYDACETMKALNEMNHEVGIESHDSNSVCGVKVPSEKELWKHVKEKRGDIYKDFKKLFN